MALDKKAEYLETKNNKKYLIYIFRCKKNSYMYTAKDHKCLLFSVS